MVLKFLFLFWFISLNLGQFSALTKSTFGGFYAFDLFAVLWVFYGLLYFLIRKRKSFFIPKEYFLLFAFIFIGIISLVGVLPRFSRIELIYSSFYLIRFILYFISGILFFNCYKSGLFSSDFIYSSIALSAVFISFAGLIQLLVLPDFTVLDPSLGWDPHKNRLASTFFDPNFTGAYLVLCLNFLITGKKYLKSFFVPLILLVILSILLTFSRSSWLMLTISVGVWGLFKYRMLLLLSFFIAFSAYFAVPRIQTRISGITDPADSAHFRLISWQNTWEIAKDNLLLGTGFNTFRFVQKDYGYFGVDWGGHSGGGSDSSLFLVLATTGILGFFFFLGFFILLITKAFKYLPDPSSLLLLSSLGGLLVESFFINSLFFPQILFLWGIIVSFSLINLSYK